MRQAQRRITKLESTANKHVVKELQLFIYDVENREYPHKKETYDVDRPVLRLILNKAQGEAEEYKNTP